MSNSNPLCSANRCGRKLEVCTTTQPSLKDLTSQDSVSSSVLFGSMSALKAGNAWSSDVVERSEPFLPFLLALPQKKERQRIISRIGQLANWLMIHDPPDSKQLSGHDKYRIRKGSYRIVYSIEDNELVVVVV